VAGSSPVRTANYLWVNLKTFILNRMEVFCFIKFHSNTVLGSPMVQHIKNVVHLATDLVNMIN
ncbi:MAG: hypothetical protein NTU43_04885, partial [Bacteroidetes bacterium]|nr:hypothetical protein [Bacteroidota bacterium]